jgi:molecular chaperone HscB
VNIASDFYEIFSLSLDWKVDRDQLDARFRKLQQQFHPDRFATKSDIEKRRAVQIASIINQAYETLKDPLARAQYLLQLRDYDSSQESHITSDAQFLMDQMLLREALSDVKTDSNPLSAIESLAIEADQRYLELQGEFARDYYAERYDDAFETVAKMQFADKFINEIAQLKTQLEDL